MKVTSTATFEAIQWTGKNTKAVREWANRQMAEVKAHALTPPQHWFVARSMANSTENQSWNYIRDGRGWGSTIEAAVYDPAMPYGWTGMEKGWWIVALGQHLVVMPPETFAKQYREA